MLKEVKIALISVVVGAFLGFGFTIGYDIWKEQRQEQKENKILCRKLVEEIRYNIKKALIMELIGKFTPFRIEEWLNFTGSPAFYNLSDDIKRTLDSFYAILRFYNDDLYEYKKLEDKAEYELKVEYLSKFVAPFLDHLVKNGIIENSDATSQWIIPEELKRSSSAISKEEYGVAGADRVKTKTIDITTEGK